MVKTTFAHNMKKYRQFLGISQEKLSEISGLDMSYIGRIEREVVCPTLSTANKISVALDVSLSYLVSENFEINLTRYALIKWSDGNVKFSNIDASKMNSKTIDLLDSLIY